MWKALLRAGKARPRRKSTQDFSEEQSSLLFANYATGILCSGCLDSRGPFFWGGVSKKICSYLAMGPRGRKRQVSRVSMDASMMKGMSL